MLRYIRGSALRHHPLLADTMFRDRSAQFRDRLRWEVTVDGRGWERDGYDAIDPLYVIWQGTDGRHGGSMRLLPTTGRTMVAEHFAHLVPDGLPRGPHIWECTRFCLAPGADGRIAAALMLGGGEVMQRLGVRHFIGVFDHRMTRIYRMIGSSPRVLGTVGDGRARIAVGLWDHDPADRVRVLARAGLSSELSAHWFGTAFGAACDAGPKALAG